MAISKGSGSQGKSISGDDSKSHKPHGPWEFDESVASCFDDMLERSIPQYRVMRSLCESIGRRYVQPGTDVVDLGCSRGGAMATFLEFCRGKSRCRGYEISEPMLKEARSSLARDISLGHASVDRLDLRRTYPDVKASVTLSVLTLQFVPIEYRHRVVSRAFETTVPGGCLILVEKILGGSAASDSLMVDVYYDLKRSNGYDQDSIDRKKLSLEGKLVPVTADWNEQLLDAAVFRKVERFWQWMNFAGWLAIKD